ncbi:MAG: enoyl-[acyl-carrier-protein] reductase FabI [Spirochaetaceae bacterium]|nr:MAG: enoyl-[acyl-carrier-protein] reductase FabI [Spirochaetaceae bacterium]
MSGIVDLNGKKGLVIGMANQDSIAYACAKKFRAAGAELAVTYLNEKAEKYVRPLAEDVQASIIVPCNVQVEGELEAVFAEIEKKWGKLDFLVHSIAFAPLQDLHGRLTDCSLEGFLMAMDVSCHSLMRMTKLAEPLMKDGGSIISMTYHGSQQVIENYQVMGPAKAALESSTRYLAAELAEKRIRVNCISPGPLRTRAASGIKDFENLMQFAEKRVANYSDISQEDVGNMAAFLVSDAAKALSGYNYYVDGGLSTIGA